MNGSIDMLAGRLVEHELQLMTINQLGRLKTAIDDIVKTLTAAPAPAQVGQQGVSQ